MNVSYLRIEDLKLISPLNTDLDSLAGAVAYRHCLPPPKSGVSTASAFHNASSKAGLYLATASADRLDMFGRLNKDNVR